MRRIETDSLGKIELNADVAYGSQTMRSLANFPITGVSINHYPEVVVALAMVKKACALSNHDLGGLSDDKTQNITAVCDEIINGQHHEHFVVDLIQGGAGTSTNMNANEVIANLALKRMGLEFGEYSFIHPNDDVNRSQSTNDVYPTALRLAILAKSKPLLAVMNKLVQSFKVKSEEFHDVLKVGRTQLQDAVPMSLGQEFKGFSTTIAEDIDRINELSLLLTEVNLGGTAIGTGINSPAGYRESVIAHLCRISDYKLTSAADLVEASSDLGAFVMFSSTLKRVAIKLSKVCNDMRLLSSGPRSGFGEIVLPPVQAGSSIMPGKTNPVIPEVVNQVCYQAIGNDLVITMAAEAGQLQLNAMEPVIFYKLMETMSTLTNAMEVLSVKCVKGITADREHCAAMVERSLIFATALVPIVGYEESTRVAKYAHANGLTLRKALEQNSTLSTEEIDSAFEVFSSRCTA